MQRIEEGRNQAAAAHGEADGNRAGERENEADRHPPHRGEDVEQRLAVAENHRDLLERRPRRGKAVDADEARGKVPREQQRQAGQHRRHAGDRGEGRCRTPQDVGMTELIAGSSHHALPSSDGSSICRSIETT